MKAALRRRWHLYAAEEWVLRVVERKRLRRRRAALSRVGQFELQRGRLAGKLVDSYFEARSLSRQEKRPLGLDGNLLCASQRALCQCGHDRRWQRSFEFGQHHHPASSDEVVLDVVELNDRSGQLVCAIDSPDQRVESHVDGS